MKTKPQTFDIPYIGYDSGSDHGWPFDVLQGQYGNPIIGFKIKNNVEQYSADPDSYREFHTLLSQVISISGENTTVQKLDIFRKDIYSADPSDEYLQQKYSDHFEGRKFKTIDTLLLFTDLVEDKFKKKNKQYFFNEKSYKELRDRVQKIYMLLKQYGSNPVYLMEADYEYYLAGILGMKFSDVPSYTNLKSTDSYLNIRNQFVKTICFIDSEEIDLPNEIDTYSYIGGNSAAAETAVDNFTFINELDNYNILIYNQVICIPSQAPKMRELEKKRKKHEGVANSAPSNALSAVEIEDFLMDVTMNGGLIVNSHYSIAFASDTLEEMEQTKSNIESQLFRKGIKTSEKDYNQLELFRCCLPGNAVELKEYDLFTTSSDVALSFFFKESFPVDEDSNFFLRFTDRQGVPLKVDLADLPMKQGRINNRNKFVLGPSGSGKSFLMNNMIEQYLSTNYDVVIVDTGDSYSGLCAYKGGRYIQYTEDKPITMNPFIMAKEEFNIEKIEFLSNLIFLIWQGADSTMSATQKSILDNVLMSYYHEFFNKDNNWYDDKTDEDLLFYLQKFNIHEDDIIEEMEKSFTTAKTYYDILQLPFDATPEEVKINGKKLIKLHHPDSNRDNPDFEHDKFYEVYEAYQTLSDETKRAIYNDTQLILIQTTDLIKTPKTNEEYSEQFRLALIKKIKSLSEKLSVTDLSFNGFYDYADAFLPIYFQNKKHAIKEGEFNLRTFLFVLKDFYKGGRYGTTLNQSADSTLFEETFIVFEIDNVKDNPKLFPIVTLIIMDTFIQKMRMRKDKRKALIIEEAWKAIASKLMGGYILYLYKTVRKFWGEAIVVTQELDDIIGNAVVKDSIINNSDTFILLDQTKFKDNFHRIADILSLNKVEQNKIFTINNLNNKFGRARFKEFYLKRGSKGEVYGNEVSIQQYLTYTTEKPEKNAIEFYLKDDRTYDDALDIFLEDLNRFGDELGSMVALINIYKKPIDQKVINFYNEIKQQDKTGNVFKVIDNILLKENKTLDQFINSNSNNYEKV